MSNIMRSAYYAGVGLYDKVREEMDGLVRRGEHRRFDGDRVLVPGLPSADALRLAQLEARVRQLELELEEWHRREEDANELVEALAP